MFQTLQNTVTLGFNLVPDGPILVRAQQVGIDPGLADMEFQRTRHQGKNTVFLAGSGLKGVLRSHGERILRSMERFACDPTKVTDDSTCGKKKRGSSEERDPRNYPHAGQCGACFTFGSLLLAGRFRVADAYPVAGREEETNRTEMRTGVGIDRKSQAAAQGVLYDSEVVVGGAFQARLSGENFSLWQLGLILASLQDLDAGLARVGGCKARGMGSVRVEDLAVELGFLNAEKGRLTGVRAVEGSESRYRLPQDDRIPLPDGGQEGQKGLFRSARYEGKAVEGLAAALIDGPLQKYLQGGR